MSDDTTSPLWPKAGEAFGIRQWNERSIQQQVHGLLNQPLALSGFITNLLERFVLNHNDKTFKARTQFLRSVKELETAFDEVCSHRLEQEIRQLELELKRDDLKDRRQKQQQLADLKHKNELLKLEIANAKMEKELKDLRKEPEPPKQEPPPPTAEQWKAKEDAERRRKKEEIEHEIERLKTDKVVAVGRASSEDDRRFLQNMYDERIRELQLELKRYL